MLNRLNQEIINEIISWRRHFHTYPELSFNEQQTSKFIIDFLKGHELKVQENIGGYGVIADLVGKNPGPTIAFRADMDAMPVNEETDLPYSSKVPNVMHACGHDGHMAALMGAVKVLSTMRDEINGTIRFIFQPAEELHPGGAKKMIEEGALNNVEAIYGFHFWSGFPTGSFYTTYGSIMAGADKFLIEINGKGGHAALPHKSIDSVLVASHIVTASQHIVSRKIDPIKSGVLTFGVLNAGTGFNVIADKALIQGTARSFTTEVREQLKNNLEKTAFSIGELHGAKINVDYKIGYPPVINHQKEAELALTTAKDVFGNENAGVMSPVMASEDFAYYLQKIPGAFNFIGAGNPSKPVYPHHHPKFQLDEDALALATEWICKTAFKYVF